MNDALRIYVGYAIDHASNAEEVEKEIKDILKASGRKYVAFFPRLPYEISGLEGNSAIDYVRRVNEAAIVNCDVCLFVSTGAFSMGLPTEIDLATKMGKSWVFYDKSGKKPGVYLRTMCRQNSTITDCKDRAVDWLERV